MAYDDTDYSFGLIRAETTYKRAKRVRGPESRESLRQQRIRAREKASPIADAIFSGLSPETKLRLRAAIWERVGYPAIREILGVVDLNSTVIRRIKTLSYNESKKVRADE